MIDWNALITDPMIQALGWTLIHSLWQGLIIAVLLSFVLSLLWKESANTRYLSSISAMMAIVICLGGTFAWQYQVRKNQQLTQENSADMQAMIFVEFGEEENAEEAGFWEAEWVIALEENLQKNMPVVVFCWLLGALAFTVKFAGGYLYLYRLTHYQLTPLSKDWNQKAQTLANQIGLRRAVKVFESALVDEPLTLRHFKPVILIPAGLISGLHPDQLEAILLHEMAHIRRADYLINLVQSLVEIVLFYHPAVWWISGRIRQTREESCDDQVMQTGRDVMTYAEALTTVQSMYRSPKPMLTMTAIGKKGQFTARIQRLFGQPQKQNSGGKSLLSVLVIMVCLGTLAFKQPAPANQNEPVSEPAPVVNNVQPEALNIPEPLAIAEAPASVEVPTALPAETVKEEPPIRIHITSKTSLEELRRMKAKLSKQGVELKFKPIFDEDGALVDISGSVKMENGNSGTFTSSGEKLFVNIKIGKDLGLNIQVGNENNTWVSEEAPEVEVENVFEEATEALAEEVVVEEGWESAEENSFVEENPVAIEPMESTVKIRSNEGDPNKQPLFVVDGVIVEGNKESVLKEIEPNNIESINVLKGNAAEAIYEERGKNGVILITTKNRKGPKTKSEKEIELKIKEEKKKKKLIEEKLKYQKLKEEKEKGKVKKEYIFGKEDVSRMGEKPLFIIDGKEIGKIKGHPGVTIKKMIENKELNQNDLESVFFISPVKAQNSYGNRAKDGAVVINLKGNHSGISQSEFTQRVNVYPNPANGETKVVLDMAEAGDVNVSIYDISGKVVRSSNTTFGPGEQVIVLMLTDLPSGVYNIHVRNGENVVVKKLVKE